MARSVRLPPSRPRSRAADLPLKGGGAKRDDDGEPLSVQRVYLIPLP